MYNHVKGHQVVLDFIYESNPLSNEHLMSSIFLQLKNIIQKTSLRIVAESMVILPVPEHESEAGGTMFFQLDSSHVSAHLYYTSKLLAVDVFGCGFTDIEFVADEVIEAMDDILPDVITTYRKSFSRFHH
jgi:S-adenosylmethionine/arginine decarboxylase-like enzyme